MIKQIKILCALVGVLMLIFIAGCTSDSKGSVTNEKEVPTNVEAAENAENDTGTNENKVKVKIYFSNQDATKLIAEEREISSEDKYTAVIQELIKGTVHEHSVSLIPKATILRSVKVADGIAYVDFNDAIVRNFNGGSGAEIILVASIVDTLTEFPEVQQVQILLNGSTMETITGHLDTSKPFKRITDVL